MTKMIILLVILVIVTAVFVFKVLSRKKSYPPQSIVIDPLKITIQDIDRMEDGTGFVEYLYRLFLAMGYSDAYKTRGGRNFGSDLVFTDGEGYRNVVQAKRYSYPVGLGAVQEVYSSMKYYRAKKAMVISSNQYTSACEELASYTGVRLHSRSDLIEIINFFKSGQIDKAKDILESEPRIILESEPRIILESWDNYLNSNRVIKKDFKVE